MVYDTLKSRKNTCLFVCFLKKDFGGNATSHCCKQGQEAKISLSYFAQNSQQLKMFLQ